MESKPHRKVDKLSFLLGRWDGYGKGKFPTIDSFDYREELCFSCDGFNDLIHYEQRTWLLCNDTEEPAHWESGFIKPVESSNNIFKISNAQDSGRVEVLEGNYIEKNSTHSLHFKMKLIKNDPRMLYSERVYTINKNELSYVMKMTTQTTTKHQQHLKAILKKA